MTRYTVEFSPLIIGGLTVGWHSYLVKRTDTEFNGDGEVIRGGIAPGANYELHPPVYIQVGRLEYSLDAYGIDTTETFRNAFQLNLDSSDWNSMSTLALEIHAMDMPYYVGNINSNSVITSLLSSINLDISHFFPAFPQYTQFWGFSTLLSGSGNDTLRGFAGGDTIHDFGGDDIFRGGDDDHQVLFDYGDGVDTVKYDWKGATPYAAEVLVKSSYIDVLNDGRGGRDILQSIEKVIVSDHTVRDILSFEDYTGQIHLRSSEGSFILYIGNVGIAFQTASFLGFEDLYISHLGGYVDLQQSTTEEIRVFGGDGKDIVLGSDLQVEIHGGGRNDSLYGGNGNDQIFGDDGDDILSGRITTGASSGVQIDTLTGGIGSDKFYVHAGTSVTDLEPSDRVYFNGIELPKTIKEDEDGNYVDGNGLVYIYENGGVTISLPGGGQIHLGGNGTSNEDGWSLGPISGKAYEPDEPDDGAGDGGNYGIGGPPPIDHEPPPYRGDSDPINRPPVDPIVIDLNKNGVELISPDASSVNMDMDENGYAERVAWVSPSDGFLAIDRNSNGIIDGLSDLFGNATTDGFDVLRGFDSNYDNKIDSSDALFDNLRIWQDANSDGVAQATEVNSLNHWGITEISLQTTLINQRLAGSNIASTAEVKFSDNTTTTVGSVYFGRDAVLSEWVAPSGFTINADAKILPGLIGYGDVKNLSAEMTINSGLLLDVQALVGSTGTMSGAQLQAAFEDVLLKWTEADLVAEGSRGAHVDAQHLAVIEKFYGGQFTQTVAGVVTHNPIDWVGADLEVLYQKMLSSMMTTFYGQVPASMAAIQNDPTLNISHEFAALKMLNGYSEIGEDAFTVSLLAITGNEPTDIDTKFAYYEKIMTLARGAVVNIFDGDVSAYKEAYSSFFDADMKAYIDAITDRAESYVGTSGSDIYSGSSTHDAILGGAGSDTLEGLDGHDILVGGSDNDILSSGNGNDILVGSTGNDALNGGAGHDRYIYNLGDGVDTIADYRYDGWNYIGNDLQFGNRLNSVDAIVTWNNADIVITFAGQTGSVTLAGFDEDWGRGVDAISFNDGVVWNFADIQKAAIAQQIAGGATSIYGFHNGADTIIGTAVSESIYSLNGNDTLAGGSGNDLLYGERGHDTYIYNVGDGDDVIYDYTYDGWTYNGNELHLGAGLNSSDVQLGWNNLDLVITFAGQTGSVTLAGFDEDWGRGVDSITFGDNVSWSASDIRTHAIAQQIAGGATTIYGFRNSNDTIVGTSANDWIYAQDGDDLVTGGAGSDFLFGGFGQDTFVFNTGDGADTIADFDIWADHVQLNGMASSFTEITITDTAAGAQISYDGELVATLSNVLGVNLTQDKFIFA